jgi:hypothetical protein
LIAAGELRLDSSKQKEITNINIISKLDLSTLTLADNNRQQYPSIITYQIEIRRDFKKLKKSIDKLINTLYIDNSVMENGNKEQGVKPLLRLVFSSWMNLENYIV